MFRYGFSFSLLAICGCTGTVPQLSLAHRVNVPNEYRSGNFSDAHPGFSELRCMANRESPAICRSFRCPRRVTGHSKSMKNGVFSLVGGLLLTASSLYYRNVRFDVTFWGAPMQFVVTGLSLSFQPRFYMDFLALSIDFTFFSFLAWCVVAATGLFRKLLSRSQRARRKIKIGLFSLSVLGFVLVSLCSCQHSNEPSNISAGSQSNLPLEFQPGILDRLQSNYDGTVKSAINGSSYPGEFNRLFPGADNRISYYTGAVGPTAWTSSIGLFRRYILKMHLSITLDNARTTVISNGPPTFYLYELPQITRAKNGNPYIAINQLATFSADGWEQLMESKGDFRVLGFNLETNKPVDGFEDNWRF